jgi:two-component system sensor histidine kinase DegS
VTAHTPVDPIDHAIRMVEEERRRIARDLHDGPAQALTNLSMRLNLIQRLLVNRPEMASSEIDKVNHGILQAVNEIRRLIFDLRPISIDELGVIQATRELCHRFAREWNVRIQVESDDATYFQFSAAKQMIVFRLITEMLNNVHKHAEATHIQVRFTYQPSAWRVSVTDNGKGFDTHAIPQGRYGILGLRERAELLGGTLRIESTIGEGSTFTIEIPQM